MPSLKVFRIEFLEPRATFSPGEDVNGNIVIEVSKAKRFEGLIITAKGEARVKWSESKQAASSGKSVTICTNHEEYFHIKQNVVEAQTSIPAGVHKYPFSFQLPNNIPCSFEHEYGRVRYTINAMILRPWKFNRECKTAFTVVSSLDLNSYHSECLGIDDEASKNFCCFCCFCCIKQGSVRVRIQIPSSGYVPGQSIKTTLEYTNLSKSVQITSICTKLKRKLEFYASEPMAKTKIVNCDVKSTKDSGSFTNCGLITSELKIPPIPPSGLEYCNIINLEYNLVVTICFSGPHHKLRKIYPILIGTTPLYYPSTPAPPFDEAIRTSISMPTSSINWNMLPPSYEESLTRVQNIKDENESNYVFGADDSFAPRYPVFNYPPPKKIEELVNN